MLQGKEIENLAIFHQCSGFSHVQSCLPLCTAIDEQLGMGLEGQVNYLILYMSHDIMFLLYVYTCM